MAGAETSPREEDHTVEARLLSVDVSEVAGGEAQEGVLALIRKLGFNCRRIDRFWHSFAGASSGLPHGLLVLGDLSAIVTRYSQIRAHNWVASVREKRPYFVGLVRTRMDRLYISRAEDMVRMSDMRATICRDLETDFPKCLFKAVRSLEPHSLVDVRYSPLTGQLWVEFSDGLFGFPFATRLGLLTEMRDLMLQTATVSDNGATIEILKKNGELFRVDAASIREALEGTRRPAVFHTLVGDRVRSARIRAGVSQSLLAVKTGIHQARISRLERGRHCPRLDTLERVATVLGCTVTELISEG